MNSVITDFSVATDPQLDVIAQTIVTSSTGNGNFSFTDDALQNVAASQNDFHVKLADVALGGPMAITAKNEARAALLINLRVVCRQINLQANGDLGKLQSSGAPLAKTRSSHDMPMPTGLSIKYNNISGSVDVSVDKPSVSDHGTLFAYTLVASAAADVNDWKNLHANGHSLTINALTAGQTYQFSAAYKGKDTEKLIWAPAVAKMVV
jgi:hypothetical protein